MEREFIKVMEDPCHNGEYKGAVGEVKKEFSNPELQDYCLVKLIYNPQTGDDWSNDPNPPWMLALKDNIRELNNDELIELLYTLL